MYATYYNAYNSPGPYKKKFCNVTGDRYLSPAKQGDTILIEAECLKVGRSLAFATVDIRNKSNDGRLVAQGRHTKYIAQPYIGPTIDSQ